MRNLAEAPEKKIMKAAEEEKKSVAAAEKTAEEEKKKLSTDDLEKVSGGEDPFEDIPRIEPEPIDEELRKDG
ncbi:MAG: hypothetical protein E7576_01065 [Ruminococcaceae bacterium]|jgi:hypothetical protein|nr:hypothetical protein [Oscillospiraceae bacterium]